MPIYDYFCEANQLTVEVQHPMNTTLRTWGEICYVAQIPLGETDPLADVRKLIRAPNISIPTGHSKLKESGFTKLVRRDAGVYENVTATSKEQRYVRAGERDSLPHLHKKIRD